MKFWEQREAELLAKENAYLEKYNWFEKIVDNHLTFVIFFVILLFVGFDIGLLIGFLIK